MADTRFTEEHEWISVEGDIATVGITKYAQEQLGDIVFVEMPEDGREVAKGDEAAVVESVKAASEIYAPVSGTITASNGDLDENPALVNSDPEGAAWFIKMKISDAAELESLMDADAYAKFVEGLS